MDSAASVASGWIPRLQMRQTWGTRGCGLSERFGFGRTAAKAVAENKLLIAAVNRCATQKQCRIELFRSL